MPPRLGGTMPQWTAARLNPPRPVPRPFAPRGWPPSAGPGAPAEQTGGPKRGRPRSGLRSSLDAAGGNPIFVGGFGRRRGLRSVPPGGGHTGHATAPPAAAPSGPTRRRPVERRYAGWRRGVHATFWSGRHRRQSSGAAGTAGRRVDRRHAAWRRGAHATFWSGRHRRQSSGAAGTAGRKCVRLPSRSLRFSLSVITLRTLRGGEDL